MADKDAAAADEGASKAAAKKKKLIMGVAALGLAGGGYYQFMMPKEDAHAAEPAPVPGPVLKLDPINVNLADGHFLKVGVALQTVVDESGHGEPDGSKALDIMISNLSNRSITELQSNTSREKVKAELKKKIVKAYVDHETKHSTMMDIYFTEFVMQ